MGYITNYWNIFWYEHIQLDIFITTNTMGYNIYIYTVYIYICKYICIYIYTLCISIQPALWDIEWDIS